MKRSEILARLLVITSLVFVLAIPFVSQRFGTRSVIEIHGQMAESGGWTPGSIQAQTGIPLQLRLTSDDVMHGFAIGQSNTPAVDVLPGKITYVTLTFDKPGTYTYYCTRWCGPNHWRMRGSIEVTGGVLPTPQKGSQPLYMTLNLDIDAAHPAAAIPDGIPNPQLAATFISKLPTQYLASDSYRSHSPAQVYLDLRSDPKLSSLTNSAIWDLVAYVWQANTTSEKMLEGQLLYAKNCAACHGETGRGNGVFSGDVKAQSGKSPVNFTDPASMLGASPALLQGKILRGGMGTGMPYWGPIFTDQQTWDVIAYLYSFQFAEAVSK